MCRPCSSGSGNFFGGAWYVSSNCSNLGAGTDYAFEVLNLSGYVVDEVTCETYPVSGPSTDETFTDFASAAFTNTGSESRFCEVSFIAPKPVFVDVVVDGGTAVRADFEVEVYDTDGGEAIATATGSVTIDALGDSTVCTVTMGYVTQTLSIDIDVINDNFGNSIADEFTIEVYDTDDALVASGMDPEPGPDNASFEAVLPIGEYTLGVEGPEGYIVTVTVTEVPTGGPTKPLGDSSAFTLAQNITVVVALQVDDDPAATTTTVAPTTTIAATTTAPATTTPATTAPTTTGPATDVATTAPPATTTPAPPTTAATPTDLLPATGSESLSLALLAAGRWPAQAPCSPHDAADRLRAARRRR